VPDLLTRELQLVLTVQRRLHRPAFVTGARTLGAAGEHALAWIGAGAVGATLDRRRRTDWVRATGVVVLAHGMSVGLKRVARRARPAHADLRVHHGLGGRWGMPSSHAASTTAAAIVFGRLLGTRTTLGLPPVMGVSRLVVGAHYPSDVLVGGAIGAATALAAGRIAR
jgi:membrane-associated phospholipid phosphatase